jgi:hypothetical protein
MDGVAVVDGVGLMVTDALREAERVLDAVVVAERVDDTVPVTERETVRDEVTALDADGDTDADAD